MANVSSSNGLEKHPKLRFKGFTEPWKTVRIGEVYAERSERGAEDMELLSVTMNDGVKMRSDIEGKDNSSEDKSNYKIVRAGDMVYNSMRMWQGANGISPWDGIVSPAYTVLKPRMPISNGFFAALFKTHRLINEFRKNSQGMTSDTWNLKYPQIETIKTCIPALAEQEKIADFLMALDQRIEKQRSLVEHLKKYKRGVISKLLSRSLDFSNSASIDWVSHRVGDFCTVQMCKRIFKEQTSTEGDVPFYKIGTIGGEPDAYISREVYEEYRRKYNFPRKGEFLISCAGTVGKCVVYNGEDSYYQDSNIVWLRNESEFVLNEYLYLLVSNVDWSTLNSTTITRIYNDNLRDLVFDFPPIEVQKKISEFCVALDKRVEGEAYNLSKLLTLKQGLIQGLFA